MTTTDVLAALTQLRSEWPNQAWSWDGRMSMVSSAVTGDQIAAARTVAERAMPLVFDAQSLAGAPENVRTVVANTGGLRGNQVAFSHGSALGLWWPWGGGGTVSLRIGIVGEDDAKLREIFGV